jgi:iron(III) transport system permease protein
MGKPKQANSNWCARVLNGNFSHVCRFWGEEAARSLGAGNREILWCVSIPLLRSGLLSAGLLVFIEVMKEMPTTLLPRPFGWDTLATRVFEMTSEGQWEHATLPAVTLVLAGLIPVSC